jgi:putative membrane protein insertion efficiency factor
MTNSNTTSSKPSVAPMSPSHSPGARVILGSISFYQRLRSGRPSPCRFYPSCSQYAQEAVAVHGAWRGSGLALRRLLRCRPLGPHGVDLVPELKKVRSS